MSLQRNRLPGELVFAFILAAFSLAAFWQAYLISGFTGLSKPGVFPMLASGTMLISVFFILREAMQKKSSVNSSNKHGLSRGAHFLKEMTPTRFIMMMIIVSLYLASMSWLGFVISSSLFLFVSFKYLWRKGILLSLLLAVFSLVVIYFIFRLGFQVVLPKGSLIPAGIF